MAQEKLTEAVLKGLVLPEGEVQLYVWDTRTQGLGVVVGAKLKTFVARAWVKGKRRRVKLGTWPETSLEDARAKALSMLGTMAGGVDPNAQLRAERSGGPTLQEALDFHLGKMSRGENRRHKVCSPRSIASLRDTVTLHLASYLEEPLLSLTADVLDGVRDNLEKKTKARSGAVNPAGRATGVRLLANVSAIWRSWHKRHGLAVPNPTERLTQAALAPKTARVDNVELPTWYAKLYAKGHDGRDVVSPIRRDLQLVSMFSGVRAYGLRHLRWDDVDFDDEQIQITHAKGGRPYTIPMTATLKEILERRQEENEADKFFLPLGGDHGWVFPSVARDGETVIALAEPKERRAVRDAHGRAQHHDDGGLVLEKYLPGTHTNRRTYNSVALEVGVPLEAREALMNHSGRGVNVKHYGVPQNWDYLRSQADAIEAALWTRIRGELPAKKKGKRKGKGKLKAA